MRFSKRSSICRFAATIAFLVIAGEGGCAWAGFIPTTPFEHGESGATASDLGNSRRDGSREKAFDHWCRDAYGWCLAIGSAGDSTRASGLATGGWNRSDWVGGRTATPQPNRGRVASTNRGNARSYGTSASNRGSSNPRNTPTKAAYSTRGNSSKPAFSRSSKSSNSYDRRGPSNDDWRDNSLSNERPRDFVHSDGFVENNWFARDDRHDSGRQEIMGWGGWPGSDWDDRGTRNGYSHGGKSGGRHFPRDFDWDCWRPGWGKHDDGGDRDRCDRFVWCHDTHHDQWWKDCRHDHHSSCDHRPAPCRDYPPWCRDPHPCPPPHCHPPHCNPDPCHPPEHCPVPVPSTVVLSASGLIFAGLSRGARRLLRCRHTD